MEEQIVETKTKKPKKPIKKFSKITALSLILLTLVFCGVLIFFLSENLLTNNSDNRLVAQIAYDKKQVNKKPNDPATRVQLGHTYYMNGDTTAAIEQYKTAIKLNKDYYPAFLNLAILYDSENESGKALENATKALKLAPNDAKSALLKGVSYRKLKMYDKASAMLEKAVSLNPTSSDIIYEIGYLAELQKEYASAKEIYKSALEYNPIYKPALKGLKRVNEKIK